MSQRARAEKMAPNHRLPKGKARNRDQYLVERCEGLNVLHLACVAWPFTARLIENGDLLHGRLAESASRIAGIDIREEGLSMLRAEGFDNLHHANLLDVDDFRRAVAAIGFVPDVIVAGEVVEHLDRPGLFLDNCREIIHPDAELLVTVPNAFSLRGLVRVFAGYEKVSADHVAYYSPSNILELVSRSDFELEETIWYHSDNRLHTLERIADAVMRPLMHFRPQLADGLIARCRPSANSLVAQP